MIQSLAEQIQVIPDRTTDGLIKRKDVMAVVVTAEAEWAGKVERLAELYRECRAALWRFDAQDPEIYDAATQAALTQARNGP